MQLVRTAYLFNGTRLSHEVIFEYRVNSWLFNDIKGVRSGMYTWVNWFTETTIDEKFIPVSSSRTWADVINFVEQYNANPKPSLLTTDACRMWGQI